MSVGAKIGVVALLAVCVYVSAVRTITRPSGQLCPPRGLSKWSLLAEMRPDEAVSLPPLVVSLTQRAAVPIVESAPNRRPVARPILRRLNVPHRSKIPPRPPTEPADPY